MRVRFLISQWRISDLEFQLWLWPDADASRTAIYYWLELPALMSPGICILQSH